MAKSLEEIEAEFRAQYQLQAQEFQKQGNEAEGENILSLSEVDLPVSKKKGNKAARASIVSDIIFYFALVAMVLCAFIFTRSNNENKLFGGYRFYEVLTTSMESVYPRGSLVLVKTTEVNDLVVGDDITFYTDPTTTVTHRIIEILENYEEGGKRAFVTKGVDNALQDNDVVIADNVVGKVVKGIPHLGNIITWIGDNLWVLLAMFISLILTSFLLKLYWRNSLEEKKERRQEQTRQMIEEAKSMKRDKNIF